MSIESEFPPLEVTPRRRVSDRDCPDPCLSILDVHRRLGDGTARMDSIEAKLDQNCADTAEVLDILRLGKSFFRMIGYAGTFIKWAAAIAAPLVAIFYTVKSGGK